MASKEQKTGRVVVHAPASWVGNSLELRTPPDRSDFKLFANVIEGEDGFKAVFSVVPVGNYTVKAGAFTVVDITVCEGLESEIDWRKK